MDEPSAPPPNSAGPRPPISLPRAIAFGLVPAALLGLFGLGGAGHHADPLPAWRIWVAIGMLLSTPIYLLGWSIFMLRGGARSWLRSIILALLLAGAMSGVTLSIVAAGCSWLDRRF